LLQHDGIPSRVFGNRNIRSAFLQAGVPKRQALDGSLELVTSGNYAALVSSGMVHLSQFPV
jgi:hypothetical protein